MCGIAGLLCLRRRPNGEDVAAVLRMLSVQRHRGPDDWGLLLPRSLAPSVAAIAPALAPDHLVWYDDRESERGVVMGARRLAIMDPSPRGRMPMGDGARFVAHNGEVYNHAALRAELGDPPFRSGSDSEVILHAHARWGDAALSRLRGMFAVAVFEAGPPPRVVLARDRLGIKPLYYHRTADRLVWASEVRALAASGLVARSPDPEAYVRFLQLGAVPAPVTTVAGVRALEPGTLLTAGESRVDLRRYWDPAAFAPAHAAPSAAERRAAVDETRARLAEAVALHLQADVPVGVFLSGGVDSAAVVALAAGARAEPLATFSMGFDGAPDERRYARLVADHCGTRHHEVVIGAADVAGALDGFFAAMDEPTSDGLNTYLLARAARERGVPVVLSGTGGDELFAGYRHLRRAAWLESGGRLIAALPASARGGVARAVRRTPLFAGRGLLERLDYLDRASGPGLYLAVRGLFGRTEVADLLGLVRAEVDRFGEPLASPPAPRRAAGQGIALAELRHYLANQLLKDLDVMSMAHSVEARVPFLDHPLVEHVLALAPAVKLAGRGPKPLLLAALGGALPRPVWDRPKVGFTLPLERWLAGRAGELREVSRACDVLDPNAVDRVWDGVERGRARFSRAWALVALARVEAARRAAANGGGR